MLTPARQERSLRLSFVWALAGNVVSSAAQWAVIVLLARLASPTDVGRYTLALAVTSPLLNFTNLHLRAVQATDTGHGFLFGHYAAMRILGAVAFLLATLAAALWLPWNSSMASMLAAVAAARVADAFSDLLYGHLHGRERLDRIAQSQILRSCASILLLSYVMTRGASPLEGVIAAAAAAWAGLTFFDLPVILILGGKDQLRPVWQSQDLQRLFWIALPLGFTQILNSIHANIPRYFLGIWHGAGEVGLFSAQAYAIVAANLLIVAMGQAMAPRTARAFQTDRRRYLRLISRLVLLSISIGTFGLLFTALFGQSAVSRLYGAEYGADRSTLLLLMLAGSFSYLAAALGCCLTTAHEFRSQFHLLLVASVVTTVASALLVPSGSVAGAALAHALGYATQAALSSFILWRALQSRPREDPTVQSTLQPACLES